MWGGLQTDEFWEREREKLNLDVLLPQNILVINETLEFVFIEFIKIRSSWKQHRINNILWRRDREITENRLKGPLE